MNFSEFKRLLGADPGSRDPEFLRARQSSAEFAAAAAKSDRFEVRLARALAVPVPADLTDELCRIPAKTLSVTPAWRSFALAASVLLAVTAALLVWRWEPNQAAIEEYVAMHYRYDGALVLDRGKGHVASDVESLLAELELTMDPAVAGQVGYIKFCPTPGGKGLHLIVHTKFGPVTVIVMPDVEVQDGERFNFDDLRAQLVALARGSAAIVATRNQPVSDISSVIRQAILPRALDT